MQGTVTSSRTGCRVVRRARPALDAPIDTALSDLPAELRPLVVQYAAAQAELARLRSQTTMAKIPYKTPWIDVDRAAQRLA